MRKILIIISSLVFLVFFWTQYRHFYKVDNTTFTVWKKWGGYCYITPYVYLGMSAPEKDYIKASNVGEIYLGADNNSILYIFNESHSDGADNSIEVCLDDYKYHHFATFQGSSLSERELWSQKRREYMKKIPFIRIYMRGMIVNKNDLLKKADNSISPQIY